MGPFNTRYRRLQQAAQATEAETVILARPQHREEVDLR
jgi:hypothetical protein